VALLEVRDIDLAARFGDGRDVLLLSDLSFSLEEGKVLGIIGESGAGKSMIARLVTQALPAGFRTARGTVAFEGRDLLSLSTRARRDLLGRRIAFIPQDPVSGLDPVLSIGSQFEELLRRLGLGSAKARRAEATEHLASVGLPDPPDVLRKYPHQLSGGMCQRVQIAMAFAAKPPLIVADEPTTALDVLTQSTIVALIRGLQAKHRTALIFITHDLRLAAQICDDVLVLYAGQAVERGPAKAIFSRPRHPYSLSLQRSTPRLSGPAVRLDPIPGHMPSLREIRDLPGCRFATRCPVRDPACAASLPPTRFLDERHFVRCAESCVAAVARPAIPMITGAGAPSSGQPLLEVANLGKTYVQRRGLFGPRRELMAAAGVNFELRRSEFLAIVGASGSGKSTVAKLLVGLEAPTAGRIEIEGRAIAAGAKSDWAHAREKVQMVFQNPQAALNPRRLVGSLITQAFDGARPAISAEVRRARAQELLAQVGLSADIANRFPAQLSGGQRQRVNIARALCRAPRVLIADEIVSGLDVSVQAQLLNLLLKLRADVGISLIFISHDLAVVRYLCERVIVMNRGEVVEQGPTGEIFARPQHEYTRALLAAIPPDDLAEMESAVEQARTPASAAARRDAISRGGRGGVLSA
jgi:peptide/nickel transport system ATP-binding protein